MPVIHPLWKRKFSSEGKRIAGKQAWKKDRILHDHNTPFDPGNIFKANHNGGNIPCIDDDVYNFFFQYGYKCETCKLQFEEVIPECLIDCKFMIHECGGRLYVETRQNKKLHPKFQIYISRTELVINYHHKFPFIVRTGKLFGFCMHHIDSDWSNDSIENLSYPTMSEHSSIHQYLKMNKFEEANEIIRNSVILFESRIFSKYEDLKR